MGEKNKISTEIDTGMTWDEEQVEKIFSFFLNTISKGAYLHLMQQNVDPVLKEKVFTVLRGICVDMVTGYQQRNIKILLKGVLKIYYMQQNIQQMHNEFGHGLNKK